MNVSDTLRDAAYITIGMSVIGVQRAQVRREELRKLVGELVKQADAVVEPVINAVEERIDTVVASLPAQAKPVVDQARRASKDARQQVRSRVAANA